MHGARHIRHVERLELHVGEINVACRGNFFIEAAVAQIAVAALDRTIVHALEAGDRAAARMAAQ